MAWATIKKNFKKKFGVWNGKRIIMDHEKKEMKGAPTSAREFNLFFNRFDEIASVHPPLTSFHDTFPLHNPFKPVSHYPFPTPLPQTWSALYLPPPFTSLSSPESSLNNFAGFCPFTCLPAPLPH